MRGLRTQEGSKFERFFALVQAEAEKENGVFFLDSGDGNSFSTETIEGEDLMGWLIPKSEADEFERLFSAWDNIPDKWKDRFCWVLWENKESPRVRFEYA